AGVDTINVTRLDIRNKQTHRPTLSGGEGFESLTVYEDGSVDDRSERYAGREIIGTGAESDVRRVFPHTGRLKERPQPYCTTLASGDQCPNVRYLMRERRQVDKTKRQRSLNLTIHTYSSLSPS